MPFVKNGKLAKIIKNFLPEGPVSQMEGTTVFERSNYLVDPLVLGVKLCYLYVYSDVSPCIFDCVCSYRIMLIARGRSLVLDRVSLDR